MPKVQPAQNAPGRSGRGRRVASSLAEINVVPLVDVMLVLLIIFMVTAPMIQRGVDLNLPVATRSAQISNERVERVSDKLKEGDVVRVKVLEVDRQGRIRLSMRDVDAA